MDKFIAEGQVKSERFPKTDHVELGSDGWLSPKGDYYKVVTTEHDESASYLINKSSEVKDLEAEDRLPWSYKELNPREKLKRLGFVLVRGPILCSEDVTNFTLNQLTKITESGIQIVSAFEGGVEYPAKEILKKVESVANGLLKVGVVLDLRQDLSSLREGKREREYDDQFKETTLKDIEKFVKSPLKTEINDYQFGNTKKEYELFATGVFDYLSNGFTDEMEMDLGRSIYKYRVIDLDNCKLLIQWEEYFHDGLSGGYHGDVNHHISIVVVDGRSVQAKLSKLIKDRSKLYQDTPKITTMNGNGYFSEVMSDIISSH
ncbi:MAG: hypothetical protein Q7T59_04095 [Candidatus Woesebacteria bacterium]|nr:hypothetical protein [Candidatus Woesebacteria bacterium]